jgi:hypothetical protein
MTQMGAVTEYKIVFDGLREFGVEVTSGEGFRSVRGFSTELAAQAWIAEQAEAGTNAATVRGA